MSSTFSPGIDLGASNSFIHLASATSEGDSGGGESDQEDGDQGGEDITEGEEGNGDAGGDIQILSNNIKENNMNNNLIYWSESFS